MTNSWLGNDWDSLYIQVYLQNAYDASFKVQSTVFKKKQWQQVFINWLTRSFNSVSEVIAFAPSAKLLSELRFHLSTNLDPLFIFVLIGLFENASSHSKCETNCQGSWIVHTRLLFLDNWEQDPCFAYTTIYIDINVVQRVLKPNDLCCAAIIHVY